MAAFQPDIRAILNEWDPIGVADMVADEYDCLIGPLLARLRSGAGAAEIGTFLRRELREHFGLGPDGTEATAAERLVAWWGAARGRP